MKKLLFGLLFSVSLSVLAQNGWDWGGDKIAATRKYQYLTTYMQAKKYQDCRQATNWLLINAPNLNVDLYLSGEVSEKTPAAAKESNITYIAAGHHATERYGVQSLCKHLCSKFELEHQYIEVNNSV